MNTALLTAAFQAGAQAHAEGKGVSSRLTVAKGKTRDFWEAGFFKAQKAAEALYNTPEARAARAKANKEACAWFEGVLTDLAIDIAAANAADYRRKALQAAQAERDAEAAANR